MNNYEILMSSIKRKYNTIMAVLEEKNKTKNKIEGQIKHKSQHITELNKLINEKKDILGNLLNADESINRAIFEFKILRIFDIIISLMCGGAAFFVASHYTPALLPKIISVIITIMTTLGISISCDYYRTNKAKKTIEEFKEKYNVDEIQDEIDELTIERYITEQQLDKAKLKLSKNSKDIKSLNKKITNTLSQLDIVMSAYDSAKLELDCNSDKRFNTRFNCDRLLKETMVLRRKKGDTNG